MTDAELAESLRVSFRGPVVEADEWRPLARHVNQLLERQREETLRSVFFKLKAALGAGKQQQALAVVIDAERETPLVTEKP